MFKIAPMEKERIALQACQLVAGTGDHEFKASLIWVVV